MSGALRFAPAPSGERLHLIYADAWSREDQATSFQPACQWVNWLTTEIVWPETLADQPLPICGHCVKKARNRVAWANRQLDAIEAFVASGGGSGETETGSS